jgi:uncharacterized protein with gpF-like domain
VQVPVDQGFLIALEASRLQAILKGKGKPKQPKFPRRKWEYPILQERKYVNYLIALMSRLGKVSVRWVQEEYPKALKAYQGKTDAWGYHADEDSFGLTYSLRSDLEAEQTSMDLGPGGAVEATIYSTGDAVAAWNAKRWATERALALGHVYDPAEPWMREALDEWTKTDLRLIKGLSDVYLQRIETSVLEAVQIGKRPEDLLVDILKANKGMTIDRARLIATDQCGKLLGQINKSRSQAIGLNRYQWLTVGDKRVRPTHQNANNKIGDFGNSGIWWEGNKQVSRGTSDPVVHPGQEIRCRCSSAPVWDDLLKPMDEKLLNDPYVQEELRRMGY